MKPSRIIHAIVVVLPVWLALSSHQAEAQIPYYYTARPQGFGMLSAALADAASSGTWDASTMYWNPGTLPFVQTGSPIFTHRIDWTTKAHTEQLIGPVFSLGPVTFGAAGELTHNGRIDAGEGVVTSFDEVGIDLAGSYLIMPTVGFGLLLGGRKFTFGSTTLTGAWGQVGLFYSPSPGIAYGIAYRASRGATYWAANAQSGVTPQAEIQQVLELGATMSFPARSEQPIVTLALTTEKYFPGVSQFNTKGGLEVYPWHFVALRVGFKAGSVERVARYGLGLRLDPVQLDLAIAPSRAENRFHGVSLSVIL